MEWIVKIEDKLDQRILVKFDPLNESIIFIGQYKPHNKEWTNFSEVSRSIWYDIKDHDTWQHNDLIDVDIIQEMLYSAYNIMKERLDAYKNIAEGFSIIKLIEIKEE